jgi:hypothetical protein
MGTRDELYVKVSRVHCIYGTCRCVVLQVSILDDNLEAKDEVWTCLIY